MCLWFHWQFPASTMVPMAKLVGQQGSEARIPAFPYCFFTLLLRFRIIRSPCNGNLMGFCIANMLKKAIKFVLRDTIFAIGWGVVKTTDVKLIILNCYGAPKERFANCRGKLRQVMHCKIEFRWYSDGDTSVSWRGINNSTFCSYYCISRKENFGWREIACEPSINRVGKNRQKIFGLEISMTLAKAWRRSSRSKLLAFSTRTFIEVSHSKTWFVSSSRRTSYESTKSLKDLIFILLRSTPFSISSRRLRSIL